MFKEILDFISQYQEYIKIILGIIIFIIVLLIRNKLSKSILTFIGKICFNQSDKEQKRSSLIKSLHKPLSYFFMILGLFVAIYINVNKPVILKSFKILTILIICWAIVNYLSDNLFLLFHFGENANDKMNTTAIKFISNIMKILIIAFAVVMIISELGYNINGLLTGIGVGGLAVSLAAQDAVSNLISGFIIIFDKPFIVGDLIQTPSFVGTVENVTMRSTKVRTLEDSVVTIPNSTLTDSAIINLSRMNKRRIELELGLLYSTPNELLEKCRDKVKNYLIENEDIMEEPVRVYFSKLDDSSLNINVVCYTKTSDFDEYLNILNDLNFKIKEIIEENGASFAYPSTSVYIENK